MKYVRLVAACFVVLVCESMLANKVSAFVGWGFTPPTKVEFFDRNGQLVATVGRYDWWGQRKISNTSPGYNGRAYSAKVYGPIGSVVTFFDDQLFRQGENHLTVIKREAGPVRVWLANDIRWYHHVNDKGQLVWVPVPNRRGVYGGRYGGAPGWWYSWVLKKTQDGDNKRVDNVSSVGFGAWIIW